jgi:phosphatidylglycerol:prolipoprotein diacylglycerol transferase
MAALGLLAAIGWKVLDRFRFGGSFAISPHGLGIALGYLTGSFIFIRLASRRDYPEDLSSGIMFWALIGTIVGARLGYVFSHIGEFHSVVAVVQIYKGGISLLGGIIGAIIASFIVVRARAPKGLSFVKGLDAASFPIALGVVIGRIGDLIIGDHLGKPTSWLLAFRYHGGNLAGYECLGGVCNIALSGGHIQTITAQGAVLRNANGAVLRQGVGVHQTAMYDLVIAMGIALLLLWLDRRPRRPGLLIAAFGLWYGTGRIITDFLRVENRFLGLTGSQWTSIVVVAFCAFTLVRYRLSPPSARHIDGQPEALEVADEPEATSTEPT